MLPDSKKNLKRFNPKNIWLHLGGVALIILMGFLVVANIKIYKKKQEFKNQVAHLQNQIENIKKSNAQLEQGIAKSDDSTYIEKVAREELDLQKPGEKTVSFIMPESKDKKVEAAVANPVQGWFSKLWDWLTAKI